jgi:adenylate kinase family enzyme
VPAPLPLLVIVSGAPGSGKTTLAKRVGVALQLPVFTKDGFKKRRSVSSPVIDSQLVAGYST